MEEIHRAKCGEWKWNFLALSGHHSPRIFMCSPTGKLPQTCPSGVLWRLHCMGRIDYYLSAYPFSAPQRMGGGGGEAEGSKRLIIVWSFW